MKNLIQASIIAVAVFAAASSAHAFGLSAVGSYNIGNSSQDPATPGEEINTGTGFGFGGLIDFKVMTGFAFETGGLYTPINKKVDAGILGSKEVNANTLIIPAVLRFTAIPIISVGAGFYYGLPMGKVKTENATGGFSNSEADGVSDFGTVLSAAFRLPIAPTLGFLIDARYMLGLKDVDTSALSTTKNRTIQILAGLNFAL